MESLVAAYSGKKVFITGHTGFKGSWLTAFLHELGAACRGYALAPEDDRQLFCLLAPLSLIDSIEADIRDGQRLTEALTAFDPDFVFHLAAQPLVRRSYEIPAETFEVNVTGTAHLLEAVRQLNKPCTVVVITTDKVYENKEQDVLYGEDDMLGGYDPYSTSKACAELVVSSYRRSFFDPAHFASHRKGVATARAGNVIGGGDWSRDRILPDIVRALEQGETITVRNPSAVRPWQHVLEPLTGYLLLGALLSGDATRYSKPFNFGPLPDGHLSVSQLVTTAIAAWGSGQWKDVSTPGALHEAGLLKLDISRAVKELGWQPKLDARQAIEWTIDWYKRPEGEQAAYTFRQIKSYLAL
ncbi:MAG TPA: CDP-glucose 4,6-dehydratase [Puia sp.]|nr:CDP-glucose 4,6-dehydratase [Puia sp.]